MKQTDGILPALKGGTPTGCNGPLLVINGAITITPINGLNGFINGITPIING